MIRLYDFELSGSCYKVRLLLNILKVSCERIPVDFVGKEHKTERFLKLNPLGEIPVMEDGDVQLRDAQSILVYIARQYDRSNTWFPDAPDSMGRIMQWLSFGGNELMAAAGARLVKLLNYPFDLPALQERAIAAFRILDAHLSDREFLELGHPTIADIACFPYVAMAGEAGIDLKPYPNILRWIDRIRQIPGFIPMPGIPMIGAVAA
ncbi:glutathione S-transferase family protein [Dongia deserti]|uniref:glutathione S-transferase family protein n=1 Tax=Dongia deserti TaxID=2268030 RepID=UPI000E64BA1F|nr:glutathione S-transferase [Dongia deserti]